MQENADIITKSSTKTTVTKPTTIVEKDIEINENIKEMKIEEKQKLTATLTPDNVTDKNIEQINEWSIRWT